MSPWAHLHMVGMLQFMSDINELSLYTPFYSVLVSVSVFMALLNFISFLEFSRQLSVFSFSSSGLISALLVLSTIYLSMKVSFSPDIFHSGCLGSKHQLTNSLYGLFNCISVPKFSRQLPAFSLCSSGLDPALLVLSTIYLFMKVSLSPDIILCG